MTNSDPFAHFDGVYVLGALDEADREEFEAHLETCPACQARVAEVRGTAGLLAGLPQSAFADSDPPPETLLPDLLRKARSERSRRRWLSASVGAVAAACLAALVVVLWPGGSPGSGPAVQAFTTVRPSPVTATAQLVSRTWGTEIRLHCRYADGVESYVPYELVVIDSAKHPHEAGSWTLTPDRTTDFTGGTAVRRDHISRVEITLADGTPILQLTP